MPWWPTPHRSFLSSNDFNHAEDTRRMSIHPPEGSILQGLRKRCNLIKKMKAQVQGVTKCSDETPPRQFGRRIYFRGNVAKIEQLSDLYSRSVTPERSHPRELHFPAVSKSYVSLATIVPLLVHYVWTVDCTPDHLNAFLLRVYHCGSRKRFIVAPGLIFTHANKYFESTKA